MKKMWLNHRLVRYGISLMIWGWVGIGLSIFVPEKAVALIESISISIMFLGVVFAGSVFVGLLIAKHKRI